MTSEEYSSVVDTLNDKLEEINKEYIHLCDEQKNLHNRISYIDETLDRVDIADIVKSNEEIMDNIQRERNDFDKIKDKIDQLNEMHNKILNTLKIKTELREDELREDDFEEIVKNHIDSDKYRCYHSELSLQLFEKDKIIDELEEKIIDFDKLKKEKKEKLIEISEVNKKLSMLCEKLNICKNMILEETLRESYKKYAAENKIKYKDSVYDSSLFDECNRYHQKQLLNNYRIDQSCGYNKDCTGWQYKNSTCDCGYFNGWSWIYNDVDVIDLRQFTINCDKPLGKLDKKPISKENITRNKWRKHYISYAAKYNILYESYDELFLECNRYHNMQLLMKVRVNNSCGHEKGSNICSGWAVRNHLCDCGEYSGWKWESPEDELKLLTNFTICSKKPVGYPTKQW